MYRSFFDKRYSMHFENEDYGFRYFKMDFEKDTEVEVIEVLDMFDISDDVGFTKTICLFKGEDEKGNVDKYAVMSKSCLPLPFDVEEGICVKGVWRVVRG